MQLPRGTFLEIRKNISIESIIAEMEQKRFTGTGNIFSGPVTATFVFREGTCILIKFRGKGGDTGWAEMQTALGEVVDVILASLDETQLKLSIEFNPTCKIVKTGTIGASHPGKARKIPGVQSAAFPAAPVQRPKTTIPAPAAPAFRNKIPSSATPSATVVHRREPVNAVPEARTEPESAAVPPVEDDLESNIDALDSMDLDHVTTRIRSDCKNLIKQLQMDHLMER